MSLVPRAAAAAGSAPRPGGGEPLDAVAAYYAARYRAFGDSARGMDWRDEQSQRLRFDVLTRALDLSGSPSILDVGCGNGELLAYLRDRGIAVQYLGIDICREMVAATRRRFGPDAATLASADDLARLGFTADYVLASGTFNVKLDAEAEGWRRHLEAAIHAMYAAARVAAAFNVTSARAEIRYDRLYYLDPADVPGLAASIGARRFLLDPGDPLFELTVTLWRG